MPITAKQIQEQLDKAIKEFGRYSYEDKGASEVMDVDTIVEDLKNTNDAKLVISILEELDKKRLNYVLVGELVCSLDTWDDAAGKEFWASGSSVIQKYY